MWLFCFSASQKFRIDTRQLNPHTNAISFERKGEGEEERTPAPFLWTKPFSTELLGASTCYRVALSAQTYFEVFNTQRVPWNLDKSTGKQLTSFWLERCWEGAWGWWEAWKLWPQAKKVGSHKHLVGECDYIPGDLETLLPACLLLPLPELPLGSRNSSRKQPFLLLAAGRRGRLRGAGPSWLKSSGDLPAFHGIPSHFFDQWKHHLPTLQEMKLVLWWWEGSQLRRRQSTWRCVTALLEEHSGAGLLLEPHPEPGMLAQKSTQPEEMGATAPNKGYEVSKVATRMCCKPIPTSTGRPWQEQDKRCHSFWDCLHWVVLSWPLIVFLTSVCFPCIAVTFFFFFAIWLSDSRYFIYMYIN